MDFGRLDRPFHTLADSCGKPLVNTPLQRAFNERGLPEGLPIWGRFPPALLPLLIAAFELAAVAADIKLPQGWQGSLHGLALINYSARLDLEASPARNGLGDLGFLLSDQRVQLKLGARSPEGAVRLLAKPEFFFDAVGEEFGADLREGYLDLTRDKWGLRVGRQIVTWGVGDLVFGR